MILGIIPARGGSAEIQDKNIKPLNGIPLIEYTISAAENSKRLDDWFVFTDKYRQYKTYDIERPDYYSKGEYGSVMKWLPYAIDQYEVKTGREVDSVMLLQPTSPLRTAEDIDSAIHIYIDNHINSLYSGYNMRLKHKSFMDGKGNSSKYFQRNGAIFLAEKEMILEGYLWDHMNVYYFEMPKSRSVDIDNMDDFFVAESIIKNRR